MEYVNLLTKEFFSEKGLGAYAEKVFRRLLKRGMDDIIKMVV